MVSSLHLFRSQLGLGIFASCPTRFVVLQQNRRGSSHLPSEGGVSGCTNHDVLVVRSRPVGFLGVEVDRGVWLDGFFVSEVYTMYIL